MDSIREILQARVLTQSYTQREALKPTILTDYFYTNPESIEGDNYTLFYDPAENRPAPLNQPGAEARVLQASGASERHATLFSAFNSIPLEGSVMSAIREPDSEALQQMARTEIGRQHGKFNERHQIMKEVIIAKILQDGVVYIGNDGEILESSSGAIMTANFGVDATHQGQLDGLIDVAWDNSAADIQTQFNNIDDQAEAENVPPPTHIWCHTLMKNLLRGNTDFRTWAAASAKDSEAILRGSMIEGLFGKTWHFYGGKYENAAGTMANYLGGTNGFTKCFLTPDPGPWLKTSQGSTILPSEVGIVSNWEEALAKTQKTYGPFSYAKLEDNPYRMVMMMGDVFGLHFADPNAIWQPTVDF